MEINIKLEKGAIAPQKEFTDSAGYDLFIPEDTYVKRGRNIIPLNFRLELPKGYGFFIFGRSGVSAKGMLGFLHKDSPEGTRHNCDVKLGLLDSGYRGIAGIIVNNRGKGFWLHEGQSIAQACIIKVEDATFIPVDSLTDSLRGEQGFNS